MNCHSPAAKWIFMHFSLFSRKNRRSLFQVGTLSEARRRFANERTQAIGTIRWCPNLASELLLKPILIATEFSDRPSSMIKVTSKPTSLFQNCFVEFCVPLLG